MTHSLSHPGKTENIVPGCVLPFDPHCPLPPPVIINKNKPVLYHVLETDKLMLL